MQGRELWLSALEEGTGAPDQSEAASGGLGGGRLSAPLPAVLPSWVSLSSLSVTPTPSPSLFSSIALSASVSILLPLLLSFPSPSGFCLCVSFPCLPLSTPFTFSNVSPASPVFRARPTLFHLMFLCLFLSPPALSPGPPILEVSPPLDVLLPLVSLLCPRSVRWAGVLAPSLGCGGGRHTHGV